MSRGVTAFHRTLRRLGRVAFGFAILGCMVALPGVAGAGDGLLIYASLSGSEFGEQALSNSALGQQRGAGLESQTPFDPGTSDNVAVILWDELQPRGSLSSVPSSFESDGSAGVSVNGTHY